MHRKRAWGSLCVFISLGATSAWAQSGARALEERLAALEARVENLEEENRRLRAQVEQALLTPATEPVVIASTSLAGVSAAVGVAPPSAAPAAKPSSPAQQPAGAATGAEKKPAGFEVGPWRAVPYGTMYFNFFSNSGGSNNADVPLFAASGHGNVSASVRQTRLGMRLEGPQVAGGKLTGVFETDFFGGFPAIGLGESFGVVRLRMAYARLQWPNTGLVVGQDWMVFAPNNPVSIASAGIPQLAASGNLWQRLPQIRFEGRGGKSAKWVGQVAVVMTGTGDFPGATGAFLLQPGAGGRARVPHFQARVGVTGDNWAHLGQPATVGLSGHYGRARLTAAAGDRESDTFGVALDWNLPLAPRVTLAGEGFFGRNLAGFQGGVFQGINPDFAFSEAPLLVLGGARGIRTRGGWAQLGVTPPGQEKLTFYASFGLDDPRDEDLVSSPARDWRERNQAFTLSFLHRLSGQFSWGVEFRRMMTQYLLSGKKTSNHVNLGVTASF